MKNTSVYRISSTSPLLKHGNYLWFLEPNFELHQLDIFVMILRMTQEFLYPVVTFFVSIYSHTFSCSFFLEYSGMSITCQMITLARLFQLHFHCQLSRILQFHLTMLHQLGWRTGPSFGESSQNGWQNWHCSCIILDS